MIAAKRADFNEIARTFGIDPLTARLIRNRGAVEKDEIQRYLYGTMEDLGDPYAMRDMDKAVGLTMKEIAGGARIRVIGDYDVDGVMASYILLTGLRALGADADAAIPDRAVDGYGLSERLIREAARDGVSFLITCDNGIAAAKEVGLAAELGMKVIVTDHHEVFEIPPADAVLDPHRPDCPYPYKSLCGAGVAYRFIEALTKAAGRRTEEAYGLLPYVAMATVADIVDLTGENRILVKEGLKRLRRTDNEGILALCEACGIDAASIDTYHIGYILGPSINAGGRLDTATRALDLLFAKGEEARRYAAELRALNESRKALTEEGVRAAVSRIAEQGGKLDRVLVLYLPEVHPSVAGIVAGRIRERVSRPTFILAPSGGEVKGSGRSIPAYSMMQELSRVGDILVRAGGHPMAAGLTILPENIDALRQRLNDACTLEEDDLKDVLHIDAAVPIRYVSEKLIEEMRLLEPFGKENERPLFAEKDVRIEGCRIIGAKGNVAKMTLVSGGSRLDAVSFRNAPELVTRVRRDPNLTVAYYPQIDNWNGRRILQAVVTDFM